MVSSSRPLPEPVSDALEMLYDRITGDEDARVCKDIPDSACADQPRNFFAYLSANVLTKMADELSSAKLVIPWLFGALGVPASFTGFLVPIREAGVLVPQLVVAALVRRVAVRKHVWMLGAVLSGLCLFGMAGAAVVFEGASAGATIVGLLIVYSLARGLCSVSAKDVLGKTVSKSRRGTLMGWGVSISGGAVLVIGLWMGLAGAENAGMGVYAALLASAGLLWLLATVLLVGIVEQPGATEGGGNALAVAVRQLRVLTRDRGFRRFVTARAMLLSVALAPPFYVLIAQSETGGGLLGFGAFVVASGLASSISAPFWGYLGDRSSRTVMALAAGGAGVLGLFTWAATTQGWNWVTGPIGFAILFLMLNVMHGGVRLGRKVYLVDMANIDNRAVYVAVSNTVIGILMLFGGLIGLVGDRFGAPATVLVLGILSLAAAGYALTLPEVSEPE